MSSCTSTDPIEMFFSHLSTLKDYATRVVVKGESLTLVEEGDKIRRLQQFLEIGNSFELTDKELVTVLYREIFTRD